jgi:sugar phosphate isomerase/epimerase
MRLAISTHWNAHRHVSGRAMVCECAQLGLLDVELGYDLTLDLAAGVRESVARGEIRVGSVHGFCPVPVGAPAGHPELFLLGSTDHRQRSSAVRYATATVDFAAEVGAGVVVMHAGRVDMPAYTRDLIALAEQGHAFEPRYDRIKMKLFMKREERVRPHLEALTRSLDELMPTLERTGVKLALENLPDWESVPNESEMEALASRFTNGRVGCWHDTGHALVRQNLGFISQRRWLERLKPHLLGMHLHAVEPPARDHLMPPRGRLDLEALRPFAEVCGRVVLEPAPGTPRDEITTAIRLIADSWQWAPAGVSPGSATEVTA